MYVHTCMHQDEELIEYTASDGTTKTMSRADLEARLREQQEDGGGLPQMGPDGALTKQKEGKASVAEVSGSVVGSVDQFGSVVISSLRLRRTYERQLREKDPFLAQVVDAAKYALSRSVVDDGWREHLAQVQSLVLMQWTD